MAVAGSRVDELQLSGERRESGGPGDARRDGKLPRRRRRFLGGRREPSNRPPALRLGRDLRGGRRRERHGDAARADRPAPGGVRKDVRPSRGRGASPAVARSTKGGSRRKFEPQPGRRLQAFVWLNTQGFEKIMKKFDKFSGKRHTPGAKAPDFEARLRGGVRRPGTRTFFGFRPFLLKLGPEFVFRRPHGERRPDREYPGSISPRGAGRGRGVGGTPGVESPRGDPTKF